MWRLSITFSTLQRNEKSEKAENPELSQKSPSVLELDSQDSSLTNGKISQMVFLLLLLQFLKWNQNLNSPKMKIWNINSGKSHQTRNKFQHPGCWLLSPAERPFLGPNSIFCPPKRFHCAATRLKEDNYSFSDPAIANNLTDTRFQKE